MNNLVLDVTYFGIQGAYGLLDTLGATQGEIIHINRLYVRDDYINVNFNFKGKRYLLVVENTAESLLACEVWNSHNKLNTLVKQRYSREEFLNGKFAIP